MILMLSLYFLLVFLVQWGNISRDNACVAGDALHPMTPSIGQGGCSELTSIAYVVGATQQSQGQIMNFLRDGCNFIGCLELW